MPAFRTLTRAALAGALLIVAGCGDASDSETDPPVETTASTTTTPGATTTSLRSTSASGPVLVFERSEPLAPVLEFVGASGDVVRTIELDRRTPRASVVADDRRDGLVVTNVPPGAEPSLFAWFRAGTDSWLWMGIDAGLAEPATMAVVERAGIPSVLYRASTSRAFNDPETGRDVIENDFAIRLQRLDTGAVGTLLDGTLRTTLSPAEGSTSTGAYPEDFGYGDDLLMVLWSDGVDPRCNWLDFRTDSGLVDLRTNPLPEGGPCQSGPVTDAAISHDGRYLLLGLLEPGRIVVHDLDEGVVVGELEARQPHFGFDGKRTIYGTRHDDLGRRVEWFVATIGDSGLEIDFTIPIDDPDPRMPIGVLPRLPDIPADLTLVTPGPLEDCSADAATELSEQEGLPRDVESTRRAIAEAAADCDLIGLADIGAEMTWRGQTDPCIEEPLVTVAERDPVPFWYAVEDTARVTASLVLALAGEPELIGDLYWWRQAGHEIAVDADGTWRQYVWTPDPAACDNP